MADDTPIRARNPYAAGLVPLAEAGALRPLNATLLVRAILPTDGSALTMDLEYRASEAVCHEVIAAGPDVQDIRPGQHVFCRSTAADRIASANTCRYWLIDRADVKAVWDPPA